MSETFVGWGHVWLTGRVPAHVTTLLALEVGSFSSTA